MKKNEEKAKVGRPKLADEKTKKESIIMCLFVFVVVAIIAVIGYNVLTIDFNPKYTVGTVYNNHINSCVLSKNTIDCGSNVIYVEYKTDNSDKISVNKEDKSIEINVDDYKKINVCYKTNTSDLKCIKK